MNVPAYLEALLGTLFLLSIYTVVGDLVVGFLPFRQRGMGRMFLRPALGFSIVLLCATLVGWLAGEKAWIVVPVTAGLVAAGLLRSSDRAGLFRAIVRVSAMGALVSVVFLLPLLLVGTYLPVSDVFTYLVHGQWLQYHPFRELTSADFTDVSATQVHIYQHLHQRMGISFLFGWVTALLRVEWSSDVYPLHVSTILTIGALGLSAQVYSLLGRRRWLSAFFGAAGVISTCGFTFGACYGFMPQSGAICLLISVAALLTNLPTLRQPPGRLALRLLPLALVLAAEGYAYHELMPYTLLMAGVWFSVNLVLRDEKRAFLRQGAVFVGLLLVLWNHEIVRMIYSVRAQMGSAPGWPNSWPPIVYFAHAIGLHSGSGDADYWIVPDKIVSLSIVYVGLGVVIAAVMKLASTRRLLARSVHLMAFGLTSLAFFLYFRYGTPSPWHDTFGNSFLQIKLTNWAALIFLSLLGYGIVRFARGPRATAAVITLLAVWMGLSLYHQGMINTGRAVGFNKEVGVRKNAFQLFKRFRRAVLNDCHGEAIYLDLGTQVKMRQLFVYFLYDQRLVSDWSDDGYITAHLQPGWETSESFARCRYCIRLHSDAGAETALFQDGNYELVEMPKRIISIASIQSDYAVERDANGWWAWTKHSLRTTFRIRGNVPRQFQLKFEGVPNGDAKSLVIRIEAGGRPVVLQSQLPSGKSTYVSPPFPVSAPEVVVTIASDGVPMRTGAKDPRLTVCMLADVRLAPLPDGAVAP